MHFFIIIQGFYNCRSFTVMKIIIVEKLLVQNITYQTSKKRSEKVLRLLTIITDFINNSLANTCSNCCPTFFAPRLRRSIAHEAYQPVCFEYDETNLDGILQLFSVEINCALRLPQAHWIRSRDYRPINPWPVKYRLSRRFTNVPCCLKYHAVEDRVPRIFVEWMVCERMTVMVQVMGPAADCSLNKNDRII